MKATVFSTSKCSWCNKVTKMLEESEIEVTKIDVAENTENFTKMQDYAGKDVRSVPQVVIDDKFIGGYTEVERFLNRYYGPVR